MELGFLYELARYVVYVALAAWALAFAGLVRALVAAILAVVRDASGEGG